MTSQLNLAVLRYNYPIYNYQSISRSIKPLRQLQVIDLTKESPISFCRTQIYISGYLMAIYHFQGVSLILEDLLDLFVSVQQLFILQIVPFLQEMFVSCYEIQQLILVMNYPASSPNSQNVFQKIINTMPSPQTSPNTLILRLISSALNIDFGRYAEAYNNKMMEGQRQNAQNQQKSQPPKPHTHSQPPLREKQIKVSVPKPIQKSQSIKASSIPKQQKPKTISAPPPPTPTLPVPQKSIKKPVVQKVVAPCKIKKKNPKIVEVKKENPGRVPKVTMLQTAQMSQSGVNEKERRRIKERLMLRQVKQWKISEQVKRDRRDLRALQ